MRQLLLSSVLAFVSAALSPAAAAETAVVAHHPRHDAGGGVGNLGWSSSNWSGYAITGSSFTSITGNWVVQSVSPTHRSSYSSQWVGIDGFNNSSLIQTGTESDYYSGTAHYDAWWEILPANETVIPSLAVSPGDQMSASIRELSPGSWSISISDTTRNETFTIDQSYSGPLTSAEWIEEAPTVNGRVARLANYGLTTFDPGTANGGSPGLVASQGGVMIQSGVQVSTPSNPDPDTDGFNAKYGSTQPAPPSS